MTCARNCLYGPIDSPSVRAAWKGQLCETCYRRLRDHLLIAAPVYALLRAQSVPSLQAVAYGDKVQTSRSPKLPFAEKPSYAADDLELVILGWAKEAFRVLPVLKDKQKREIVFDVDYIDGAMDFLQTRFDDVVTLPFIRDLHDELVPAIRDGFHLTGQKRMPLEDSIGAVCEICLTRDVYVDWVGEGADSQMKVTCKRCRSVLHVGEVVGDGR